MNVSYQEIIAEYRNRHSETTYTSICQQLAIKKLEDKVKELEDKVKELETQLLDSRDQEDAERRRADELQELLDSRE